MLKYEILVGNNIEIIYVKKRRVKLYEDLVANIMSTTPLSGLTLERWILQSSRGGTSTCITSFHTKFQSVLYSNQLKMELRQNLVEI